MFQEKEADIGANASKGDGEAGEDDDEGAEASEAQTVIDVVHAAKLQKMELSQKEFASMQKAYWKRLIDALNKDRYRALGIRVTDEDDKDSIKEKEAAALEELSAFEKKTVDACKEKMASFKANFEDLQKFVKEVVIANFGEYELSVTQRTRTQPRISRSSFFHTCTLPPFPLMIINKLAESCSSSHTNTISERRVP